VQSPNGGEELEASQNFTIAWQVDIPHDLENWDVFYSTTGAAGPWLLIVEDFTAGDGSAGALHDYEWTVPDTNSATVRVRVIMDNGGTDYDDISDDDVTIVAVAQPSEEATGMCGAGLMMPLSCIAFGLRVVGIRRATGLACGSGGCRSWER
jgi:hypothetical protein